MYRICTFTLDINGCSGKCWLVTFDCRLFNILFVFCVHTSLYLLIPQYICHLPVLTFVIKSAVKQLCRLITCMKEEPVW